MTTDLKLIRDQDIDTQQLQIRMKTLIDIVLDNTQDLVLCFNKEALLIRTNAAATNLLALPEPQNISITEFIAKQPECEKLQSLFNCSAESIVQTLHQQANKKMVLVNWRCLPYQDAELQECVCLLGAPTIIDHLQKEENLSYSQLDAALTDIPVGIYWKDIEGRFMGCNQYFLTVGGFKSKTEVVGITDYDTCWRQFADALRRNDEEVMRTRAVIRREECVENIDNELKTYLSSKAPLYDHQKNVIGIVGVSLDITGLKQHQYALAAAKKRAEEEKQAAAFYLENVIACMPGNIFWKDRHGVYLGCNESLFAKEWSADDVLGKTDFDLFDVDQAELLRLDDQAVMQAQQSISREQQITAKNAEKRYFMVTKMPLRDDDGQVIGIIGNALEITDLKNTQLELQKAKQRADLANQAKSNFLAMVSHELRTPLFGILGSSQLLNNNKALTDSERTQLGDIYESGSHLLRLVNDILDFTRLQEGKLQLKQEAFSLKQLLERTVKQAEKEIDTTKLEFSLVLDEQLPACVIGDQLRLRQVLDNLISNAVKFTDKGKIELLVNVLAASDDKISCHFALKDTGQGIPAADLDRIFERFTQLESIYKRKHQGAGLGLAVCEQLVRAMNGQIGVESELNKGSMFWFELELGVEKNASKCECLHKEAIASGVPRLGLSVLLVEDNPLNQKITQLMLQALGCRVKIADHGEAALAAASQQQFQVILMDLGLPDIDGLEVTRRLKNTERSESIPIVAMSAHAMDGDKDKCYKAGMCDVLVKPVSQERLAEVLRRAISEA